jgi:hypothetical protein
LRVYCAYGVPKLKQPSAPYLERARGGRARRPAGSNVCSTASSCSWRPAGRLAMFKAPMTMMLSRRRPPQFSFSTLCRTLRYASPLIACAMHVAQVDQERVVAARRAMTPRGAHLQAADDEVQLVDDAEQGTVGTLYVCASSSRPTPPTCLFWCAHHHRRRRLGPYICVVVGRRHGQRRGSQSQGRLAVAGGVHIKRADTAELLVDAGLEEQVEAGRSMRLGVLAGGAPLLFQLPIEQEAITSYSVL